MTMTALSLGTENVCCLTGVPRNSPADDLGMSVYRRANAFTNSTVKQAATFGVTMLEIIVREAPTIVHLASLSEGYLGLILARFLKLPFLVYAHGNEVFTEKTDWAKPKMALQHADYVVAVSQYTADLVRNWGVDDSRIRVIYPGCDIDHFRPLQPSDQLKRSLLGDRSNDSIILSVGNLVERKGHDMVIKALPIIMKTVPSVTYLIAGAGPFRPQLQQLAAEVGVGDRVKFLGEVLSEQVPELIAISDVFAMPSRLRPEYSDVEGFGLVFLEAGACEKPVIGGRSGGVAEAVVHGETGFLVDPVDPDDIARHIAQLLSDAPLAIRLGKQGRHRVLTQFTWSRVGDETRNLIRSVEDRRRAARDGDRIPARSR